MLAIASVLSFSFSTFLLQPCQAWTGSSRPTSQIDALRGSPSRRDFLAKTSEVAAALLVTTALSSPSVAVNDDLIDVYFGCGKAFAVFSTLSITSNALISNALIYVI